MAANKRKILENARKLAQKGAKDKALKEYQRLLKLDPKDAKLRLEIGDAYRRWGQVDEAIDTYSKVASQYMKEGFDARAVAVFKQILNLDPDRYDSYQPLAELYERMGLATEAIQALQTAADGFHKQGKKPEALELLRKMAGVDPTNTVSRMKVADLLRQEGMVGEATSEYQEVASELERQGDVESVGNVYRRLLELDASNVHALSSLARNLVRRGKAAEAVPLAERAAELDKADPERYSLLAEVYEQAGRDDDVSGVYIRLADLYRQRGEEDKARDILQRHVPASELSVSADELDADKDELGRNAFLDTDDSAGGNDLFEDELLGADAQVVGGESALADRSETASLLGEPSGEDSTGEEVEELLLDAPIATPDLVSAPQVDPDIDVEQLLAEASVYLRYGKRDKAIAHLESVLDVEPEHRVAIEKLGEAFADGGEDDRAVELWLRASKYAKTDGDSDAVAVLRGRIAALDEVAAASLDPSAPAPPEPTATDPPPALEDIEDLEEVAELEIEIDLGSIEEASDEIEDVDEDDDDEVVIEGLDLPDVEDDLLLDDEDDGIGLDAGPESSDALELGAPVDLNEVSTSVADAADMSLDSASLSSSTTQQILDDLEEADFYVQQDLLDEAEEIYRRILTVAPNHPRALVRLGEVAAARGDSPSATEEVVLLSEPADVPAEVSAGEAQATSDDAFDDPSERVGDEMSSELEFAIDQPSDEPVADLADDEISIDVEDDESAVVATEDLEGLSDLDLDDDDDEAAEVAASDDGEGSDTEELTPNLDASEASVADEEPVGPDPSEIVADDPPEAATPLSVGEPEPESRADDGDFDLAAALSDAFDDDPNANSLSGAASPEDSGFEAVFDAFKKGVSETLTDGDHEAHYDLAIAYKEMGLHNDAMNEFRVAMGDGARRVECLHLIGICALDGGQASVAAAHLEQLLEIPDLNEGQSVAGHYDLGRAYESLGDVEKARSAFEAVIEAQPEFCDVQERLASLGEEPEPEPASASEAFESFDDVLAEAQAPDDDPVEDPTEAKPDPGESFDDLVAEANADEPSEAEAVAEAPLAAAELATEHDDDAPVRIEPELVVEVEPMADAEPEPEAESPVAAEVADPVADVSSDPEETVPSDPQTAEPARVDPKRTGRRKKKKISFV